MLSEQKLQDLQALLSSLPGHMAVRLARVVEIDRLYDGKLPHDILLDMLRPALRKLGERERLPTPLRYFCLPFEDLLFNGARRHKQKGRISRSAILPVWNWLGRDLLVDEMEEFARDFKSLAASSDTIACESLAARFHRLAGQAMTEAFAANPQKVQDYFAACGSAAFAADAEDIAELLRGSSYVSDVRAVFPKPSPTPVQEQMQAFYNIYGRAIVQMPDIAPYLPVVAMGRLEKSWQALRLVLYVTKQHNDTLIAATDVGLAGEILFTRMEDAKLEILAADPQNFNPERLIDALSEFTLLSSAITKEIDMLRSGRWGQQLLEQRNAISSVMEGYIDRAGKQIAAAIPMKRSSEGTTALLPNFSRTVRADVEVRAGHGAMLISGCRYLASAASFQVKYREVSKDATSMLCYYNNALLEELRNGSWPDRAQVDRQFGIAVELSRFLLGVEEAKLLQRRGELARRP